MERPREVGQRSGMCTVCGEDFASRTKLHKQLSDKGHYAERDAEAQQAQPAAEEGVPPTPKTTAEKEAPDAAVDAKTKTEPEPAAKAASEKAVAGAAAESAKIDGSGA